MDQINFYTGYLIAASVISAIVGFVWWPVAYYFAAFFGGWAIGILFAALLITFQARYVGLNDEDGIYPNLRYLKVWSLSQSILLTSFTSIYFFRDLICIRQLQRWSCSVLVRPPLVGVCS